MAKSSTIANKALPYVEELNELIGFPSSVYISMNRTSALDGVSSYENEHYSVLWTYHPDRGLEIFYEMKK